MTSLILPGGFFSQHHIGKIIFWLTRPTVNVLVVITFLALVIGYLFSLRYLTRGPTCTLLIPRDAELADPARWYSRVRHPCYDSRGALAEHYRFGEAATDWTGDMKEPMH